MAAVNITFQGMFYDRITRVFYPNATMVGEAFLTGYAPGHPLPEPPPGGGGELPPWWPGHPAHPIPPTIWPDPRPPTEPPPEGPPTNPPSENWVWGYSPRYGGWTPVYLPPEGSAGPKT